MRNVSLAVLILPILHILPTGPAVRPEAPPGRRTEAWYTWSGRRGAKGFFHMVKETTDNADAPIHCTDRFVVRLGDRRLSLSLETFCKDDGRYTPVRIKSKGEGDDEFGTFDTAITWKKTAGHVEGTLKTTRRGRPVTRTLPEGTVSAFSLFHVVRTLPFDKDRPFRFHSLEASELNLKKDHVLTYCGKDRIEHDGKPVEAHKFEQTGRGIRPAQYWVSENRELLRVVMDGSKEFRLATEEKARAHAD
jgi:hypothetical protein